MELNILMSFDKIFKILLNWNLPSQYYKEILKEIQSIKKILKEIQSYNNFDQIKNKEIENNNNIDYVFKVNEYFKDNIQTIVSAIIKLELPDIPDNNLEHKFWNDTMDYIIENNQVVSSILKIYYPNEQDLSKIKFKLKS
jgi:hypothetical protein